MEEGLTTTTTTTTSTTTTTCSITNTTIIATTTNVTTTTTTTTTKDAFYTLCLSLYSVEHMTKVRPESKKRNPQPTGHGLLFSVSMKTCFINNNIYRIDDDVAFVHQFRNNR